MRNRDEKMLYSGDAQGSVKGWADEEHHEAERLYRIRAPSSFLRLPAQASPGAGEAAASKPAAKHGPAAFLFSSVPVQSGQQAAKTEDSSKGGGNDPHGRRYSLASFGPVRLAAGAFSRSSSSDHTPSEQESASTSTTAPRSSVATVKPKTGSSLRSTSARPLRQKVLLAGRPSEH